MCIQLQNLKYCHAAKKSDGSPNFEKTSNDAKIITLKAYMKSYIPLETAAIFFLANRFLKQGISSEYVMVDFICMGLLDL